VVRRDGRALVTATIETGAPAAGAAHEGEVPKPFGLSSYSHLLHFPERPESAQTSGAVDAIIVPTVRSAQQLSSAVDLASQLRCELIALYTDRLPDGLSSVLAKLKPGSATEVALSSDPERRELDLGPVISQRWPSDCATDISRKRNLGLLIGRACGWTRMLFLDDDIRRINAEKVRPAAALIDRYPVVGLQVKKYPDASVVRHARRLTGHYSQPFISGGSLLVDPQRLRGFFPAVYHEDWLCLIDNLRLGEVAIGGTVGQLRYRPFTTPDRAKLEEFGDILASGLLWLLHAVGKKSAEPSAVSRKYWQPATKALFWDHVLIQRNELLGNTVELLNRSTVHDTDAALESVKASWERCVALSSREFVTFVADWLDGLDAWQARLARVPPAGSVKQALADLGLRREVQPEPDHPRPRAAAARQKLASLLARRRERLSRSE